MIQMKMKKLEKSNPATKLWEPSPTTRKLNRMQNTLWTPRKRPAHNATLKYILWDANQSSISECPWFLQDESTFFANPEYADPMSCPHFFDSKWRGDFLQPSATAGKSRNYSGLWLEFKPLFLVCWWHWGRNFHRTVLGPVHTEFLLGTAYEHKFPTLPPQRGCV